MKKLSLFIAAVLLLTSLSAVAKKRRKKRKKMHKANYSRNYGMAGCGWGSMLMGKRDGQISAATTNGTLYNQLFGISSGTANCAEKPSDKVALNLDQFIKANMVKLAADIAKGQGESIAAVGNIMGCADNANLGRTLQGNFNGIYPSATVNYMKVTDSMISTVLADETLSANCSNAQVF